MGAVAAGPLADALTGPSTAVGQSGSGLSAIERLAAALDYDAEQMFRFVADQVRYEPYAGALRGAEGTLAAMAGNSVDQAALLAALLAAGMIDRRFAEGRLDEPTAQNVLSGASADPSAIKGRVLAAFEGPQEGRVASAGPGSSPAASPGASPAVIAAARTEGTRVAAWARDQVASTSATIEQLLRDGGIEPPAGFADLPASERDRHTWVQVRRGSEWVDLDPSAPGTALGAAVTTAAGTFDTIADDQRHRVRVAVIVERVAGGALVEDTALEVEWPADEIGVRPMLFANVRPEGFRGTGVLIGDILEGTTSYVPLLTYGDSATYGDQIRFGTGTDVFGEDPLSGAESEPTAQWLEVTVSSPDAPPVTTRREVFDRVGPAVRAAGTFDPTSLGLAELTPSGEAGRVDFLPALTVHWLTVSSGTLGGEELRAALAPTEEPEGYGLAASLYHVVRDVAGLEGALPAGVHAVVNAPNVVGVVARPFLDTDGTPSMEVGLDIIHRSFAQVPVAGVSATASPAIVAGVTSQVAERVLSGDAADDASDRAAPPVSVGAVFDEAVRQGVPLRLVRTAAEVAGLDAYPPEASARLARAMALGWVAIAPERPVTIGARVRTGWWLVDPATGRTWDELDDGRGSGGLADEALLIQNIIKTHPAWLILRVCLVGVAILAASFIGLVVAGQLDSGAAMGAFGGAGASAAFPTAVYCASV